MMHFRNLKAANVTHKRTR